ncbi:MAG TPA: Dyp-type peroxidase [Castellaniella sp.]|uniref:Dyp-type peroxidase n=1 Tax=Castellaniella sp. TaxID=1955812 RepID=UPI002F0A8F34
MPTATPQAVNAPPAQAAIFLVLSISPGAENIRTVRSFCAEISGLVRAVASRYPDGGLSCVLGVGASAWDELFGTPRPKELHGFKEVQGTHHAVATPGDMLLHLRARRMDLCFELSAQILARLGAAVAIEDETHAFQYFDARAMIGFVDGVENPSGAEATAATLVGDEDAAFAGGSYVIVQKYVHDLSSWNALPVQDQEKIIGRTKHDNIELSDEAKPSWAHNALTIIEDDGEEIEIVRGNLPYRDPAKGENGTYFIGYAKTPRPIEQMIDNMFIGRPPGNYDRLLDYSRAITGSLFFVPSASFLENA